MPGARGFENLFFFKRNIENWILNYPFSLRCCLLLNPVSQSKMSSFDSPSHHTTFGDAFLINKIGQKVLASEALSGKQFLMLYFRFVLCYYHSVSFSRNSLTLSPILGYRKVLTGAHLVGDLLRSL